MTGRSTGADTTDGTAVERPRRRGWVADLGAVTAVYVGLGLAGAVLWWLLFDPAMLTKADGAGSMGEEDLSRAFQADGLYCVVAFGLGLLSGLVLTAWRRRDPLLTTVLVVLGASAASLLMAWTGTVLGPPDPEAVLATAPDGATAPVQLTVTAHVVHLVWPVSALIGALVVLWSPPTE